MLTVEKDGFSILIIIDINNDITNDTDNNITDIILDLKYIAIIANAITIKKIR